MPVRSGGFAFRALIIAVAAKVLSRRVCVICPRRLFNCSIFLHVEIEVGKLKKNTNDYLHVPP